MAPGSRGADRPGSKESARPSTAASSSTGELSKKELRELEARASRQRKWDEGEQVKRDPSRLLDSFRSTMPYVHGTCHASDVLSPNFERQGGYAKEAGENSAEMK